MNSDSEYSTDDEEIFIKLLSSSKKDHIDYIMFGSTCYEINSNGCEHDIVIHFLNGDIDESIKNKKELKELFKQHGMQACVNDNHFEVIKHIFQDDEN